MQSRAQFDQPGRVRGFTLVELLVAISVTALIMTAAFGAIRIGNRSFEAGRDRINQSSALRSTDRTLRRQIAQALLITLPGDDGPINSFAGDDRQLRFIAPAPVADGSAGLYVFYLAVEPDASPPVMVLSYRAWDPGATEFPARDAAAGSVILSAEAAAELRYFGTLADDETARWYPEWRETSDRLPLAVALVDTTASGSDTVLPLVYAIRRDARR